MKNKILLIVLTMLAILVFAACNDNTSSPVPASSQTENQAANQTEAQVPATTSQTVSTSRNNSNEQNPLELEMWFSLLGVRHDLGVPLSTFLEHFRPDGRDAAARAEAMIEPGQRPWQVSLIIPQSGQVSSRSNIISVSVENFTDEPISATDAIVTSVTMRGMYVRSSSEAYFPPGLIISETTREEILTNLGEPDNTRSGSRVDTLTYRAANGELVLQVTNSRDLLDRVVLTMRRP